MVGKIPENKFNSPEESLTEDDFQLSVQTEENVEYQGTSCRTKRTSKSYELINIS